MPRTELIRVTTAPKPSFLSKVVDTVRAYTIGPLTSRSPELAKYFDGGGSSLAGVSVTEHTALRNSAVWAAVGLISDDVSSLPLMLYKRLENGGKDKFEVHPLYRLLHDEPNKEMSSMVFRRTMQAHVLLWGNAYAEIERDGVGRPVALWPLDPERVQFTRDASDAVVYRVTSPSGGQVAIPADDMIHLVGRSHDGSVGSSLVQHARESIGLALAAEQFGATFFGNGATFGGVISFKGPKPPEMSENGYREALEARHQGVRRAHKLLALYNDAQYKETGVAPNSAQFLETRTFQIREIARWFKIPPHKLADLADATFSNVEQMNTEYFVSALRPWLVLWEQELSRKLIARLELRQQFIKHRLEGLLRGDSASRAAFYQTLFNIGAITINEIRELEDWDPLPGGDESFVQVNNLMPLSMVQEYAKALIASMAQQPSAPMPAQVAPDPEDDSPDEDVQAMRQTLDTLETRLVDRLTAAEAAKAVADAQTEALRADVEAAAKSLAERDGALVALAARHADDLKAQIGQTAEQIAELERQWTAERDALQRQREAAQAEKNDLDVMLGVVERERDEARAAAAKQAEQAAQALEQERASHVAVRERLQARSVVPQLHRGLYADAMGRMVRREIAKAKNYQATPAKLRTWIAAFYDEAEMRIFTEALLPSLRVHLAWIGSSEDPEEYTRAIVRRHFDESAERLTAVCDAGADGYGDVLQRVLARWERERAEHFADALLAEEITHDGRAA